MKYLFINEYWSINKEYNIDKLLYLMVDRPDIIDHYGFIWTNNKNQSHRDYDLPAYVHYNYNVLYNLSWYINNSWHRENNKPALVGFDGYKRYYINGKRIKEEQIQ